MRRMVIFFTFTLSALSLLIPTQSSYAESQIYATGASLASGHSYSCAIDQSGLVSCWGAESDGQTRVPSNLGKVTQIATGGWHACAVTEYGLVRCWGFNPHGETDVPNDLGKVTLIAAGANHSCALTQKNVVRCWGSNDYGQLDVPAGLTGITEITAGAWKTCAISDKGEVFCWGGNVRGREIVPDGLGKVLHVSIGTNYMCTNDGIWRCGYEAICAVNDQGEVKCWGAAFTTPTGLGRVLSVTVGWSHICALNDGGTVSCWGDNGLNQTNVPTDLGKTIQITAGNWHTCAANYLGKVKCWGYNYYNQSSVPNDFGKILLPGPRGFGESSTPTLSGSITLNGSLNAVLGDWDSDVSFSYQWLRDGVVIPNANSSSYTLQKSDYLKKISVSVTGSKEGYVSETKTSDAVTVLKTKDRIGSLLFSSTYKVGAKAYVSPVSRNSKFDYSYQWLRNGEEIVGASSRTYLLAAGDAGSTLSARVCALYLKDVTHCVTQEAGSPVELGAIKNVRASFAGVAKVGRMFSSSPVSFDNQASVSYQWLRNSEPIADATRNTYFVDQSDKGSSISLRVTVSKPGYETVVKTSNSKLVN